MICMPIPHRPISRTEPSPKAASAEILQVGGLWEGEARGIVMMKRCIKVLWDLVLGGKKRFHTAKKAPAEAGAFFHQK